MWGVATKATGLRGLLRLAFALDPKMTLWWETAAIDIAKTDALSSPNSKAMGNRAWSLGGETQLRQRKHHLQQKQNSSKSIATTTHSLSR